MVYPWDTNTTRLKVSAMMKIGSWLAFCNFMAAMRDIAAVKKDLEEWGRSMVLLFPDEKGYKNFDPKEFGDLPGTITYGIDADGHIQKEIASAMKLQNASQLPIFIIADTFNRVTAAISRIAWLVGS